MRIAANFALYTNIHGLVVMSVRLVSSLLAEAHCPSWSDLVVCMQQTPVSHMARL